MIRFEYLAPASLEEAMLLLDKYGDEARILAGGTDLLPRLKQRLLNIRYLINIKKIPGLDNIEQDLKEGLKIGSLATIRSIEKSELIRKSYTPLWEAARVLGSVQVRNLATLGGNLCHAIPSAETAAPLLAMDARLNISSISGERHIHLKDFFKGPGKTILQKGEILKEILIPSFPLGTGGTYFKLSPRQAMDIAIVGVASVVSMKDGLCSRCHIALGAVAPTPLLATKAEDMLRGQKLEPDMLERAGQQAMEEARPISDHRGSADYRREMVRTLTIRTLEEAAKRAVAAYNS